MPNCIVRNCGNRSSCKSSKQEALEEQIKISFHRVPKNVTNRRLWLKNLGLEESYIPNDAVVCSLHFNSEDYDRTSLSRLRLKTHAIPYVLKEELNDDFIVFAEPLEEIQRCESPMQSECVSLCYVLYIPTWLVACAKCAMHTREKALKRSKKIYILPQFGTGNGNILRVEPDSSFYPYFIRQFFLGRHQTFIAHTRKNIYIYTLPTNDKGVQATRSSEDKGTCMSPSRQFHSPGKDELREHAARMKKSYQYEIKILKQKYRRSTIKIQTLEAMVQTLRQKILLQGEHIERLESI